ncbi:amidase [Actinomadura sp. KC345]|uniref:amidase family protein n=1 Tax=Actinomadura sp. KC345 TaxID=2530371 RepID=UPI001047E981|nr:amidase family protein [Actinomadura sp. KC345]TDC44853.1 amidase [Actinomadura sp. KC345]
MESAFPEEMGVRDLLQEMADGHLTSAELTARCLARIERLNPVLHSVIAVDPHALAQARAIDRLRASGGAVGPLAGIPVLVKDNIDTFGLPTTAGSVALRGAMPRRDADLVARLRRAGAVILGKTNLSEWSNFRSAGAPGAWSPVGGQARNPYVLDRSSLGSSSGSAVAAAAGLVPVAIGTDTGGSINKPAGGNAVVGLRPSHGRVGGNGIVPVSPWQDTAGPITRSVADAAALFAVIAVSHRAIRLEPGLPSGTRIGVWSGIRTEGNHPDVDRVLAEATARLHDLGATTVEVDLPVPDQDVLPFEFKEAINAYLRSAGGEHPRDLADLIAFHRDEPAERVPEFGLTKFEQAQLSDTVRSPQEYRNERERITEETRRSIGRLFGRHRLTAIMAPSNGRVPVVHGAKSAPWVDSTLPAAVGGYPSITVPAGYTDAELPLGVLFIGLRNRDEELLGLAYTFEQATRARKEPRYLPTLPV